MKMYRVVYADALGQQHTLYEGRDKKEALNKFVDYVQRMSDEELKPIICRVYECDVIAFHSES